MLVVIINRNGYTAKTASDTDNIISDSYSQTTINVFIYLLREIKKIKNRIGIYWFIYFILFMKVLLSIVANFPILIMLIDKVQQLY